MMLSDPWDLKHQIDKLQQEKKRNKQSIEQKQQSSTSITVSDDAVQTEFQLQQTPYMLSLESRDVKEISSDGEEGDDEVMHDNSRMDIQNIFRQEQLPGSQNNSQQINIRHATPRNKYGNLIVFFSTSSTFFSLGPNYLFFTFAYLCFTLASIYLVKLVNLSIESHTFRVINFSICLLQNVAYLLVAFSNPGVRLAQQQGEALVRVGDEVKYNNKLCKKCGAVQQRKTYHCRECDVCVRDYDHHCPWTSKCIGGNNLKRFYLFVSITPFYIFYYVITFMICMGNLALQQSAHLKNQAQLTKL